MQAPAQPKLEVGMTIGYESPTTQDYHGKAMFFAQIWVVTEITWKYATLVEVADVRMFDHVWHYESGREKPYRFNRTSYPGCVILD